MEQVKRNDFIDFLKGIGIILVVIGHVSQNGRINDFIYSFHMPLFFFISGFLFNYRKENFTKNKFKKIMIPYFISCIVFYLYWLLIERKIRNQNIDVMMPLKNIFCMQSINDGYVFNIVLWFLPCLFIVENIFYYCNKIFKNKVELTASLLGLISLIFNYFIVYKKFLNLENYRLYFCLDSAFMVMLFYCLGVLARKYELLDKTDEKILCNKVLKCFFIILCLLILYIDLQQINQINVMNLQIGNFINFCILTPIVVLLFKIIHKSFKMKFISNIGICSFIIMILHEPIKRILIKIFSVILNLKVDFLRENIIFIFIISIVIIMGIYILELFIKKYIRKREFI